MRDCSSASRALASTGCHSRARRSQPGPEPRRASAAPASATPSRRRPPAGVGQAQPTTAATRRAAPRAAPSASRLPSARRGERRASGRFSAHTVTSHSSVPASADEHRAATGAPASRPTLAGAEQRADAPAPPARPARRAAPACRCRRRAPRRRARRRAPSRRAADRSASATKPAEFSSAGRVLAGHTLAGRVSALPRSVSADRAALRRRSAAGPRGASAERGGPAAS